MISCNTLLYIYLKEDCEMNEFDEDFSTFRQIDRNSQQIVACFSGNDF